MTLPVPARFPLLALGIVSLIAGLWGALNRLGLPFPPVQANLVILHGPLMVCGFLGTLISLERAVGLGRTWGFLAPLASGLGGLGLVVAGDRAPGLAMTAGALALFAILVAAFRLQRSESAATLATGAACWATGNALFAGGVSIPEAVPWWIAFLVLTIAGERRELARFLRLSPTDRATFLLACLAVVAGPALGRVAIDAGTRLQGIGLVALALWLGLRDMARVSIRRKGLTRFIGVCLLSGYVWLAIGGLFAVMHGASPPGPARDASLHAIFLGFVMAMIFGHAPIIFPALLARPIPFRPVFYLHLALLHASLALRIAGDLGEVASAVRLGGTGNVVAILLFFANTLAALLRGRTDERLRTV